MWIPQSGPCHSGEAKGIQTTDLLIAKLAKAWMPCPPLLRSGAWDARRYPLLGVRRCTGGVTPSSVSALVEHDPVACALTRGSRHACLDPGRVLIASEYLFYKAPPAVLKCPGRAGCPCAVLAQSPVSQCPNTWWSGDVGDVLTPAFVEEASHDHRYTCGQ